MSVTALPSTTITTPSVAPAKFGLFSAATVIDSNDPHVMGGVDYESNLYCAGGQVTVGDLCTVTNPLGYDNGPVWDVGRPAVVSTGYSCLGPASLSDIQAGATRALAANEQRLLSAALFESILPASGTTWAADLGGTGTDPIAALAMLEGYARQVYSGQPVVHIPATIASYLGTKGAFVRVGNHLETVSGALVDILPDGDTMYVTGALIVLRGRAQVTDTVYDTSLGRPTNDFSATAIRPYVVINDGQCLYAFIVPDTDVPLTPEPVVPPRVDSITGVDAAPIRPGEPNEIVVQGEGLSADCAPVTVTDQDGAAVTPAPVFDSIDEDGALHFTWTPPSSVGNEPAVYSWALSCGDASGHVVVRSKTTLIAMDPMESAAGQMRTYVITGQGLSQDCLPVTVTPTVTEPLGTISNTVVAMNGTSITFTWLAPDETPLGATWMVGVACASDTFPITIGEGPF